MKKINNSKDFPNEQHYAIIIFDERHIHHEGDERSRTNPGHGYPAHTETINDFQYISFEHSEQGKLEWETKLKELHGKKPEQMNFVGFESGKKVSMITNITIEK